MSRFEKSKDIIRLALMMSATREGVSLIDIQDAFSVSRRTAERMRDAIFDLFPGDAVRENIGPDRIKRWSLQTIDRNRVAVTDLIDINADDIATLGTARKLLIREGITESAETIRLLQEKIQMLIRPKKLIRLEPDVEALSQAEGIAMRPGPRPKILNHIFSDIRTAILEFRKIFIHYQGRNSGATNWQIVHPYGILYGNRHYLVAYNEHVSVADIRLFALSNISEIKILPEHFDPLDGFSLNSYATRSFGVFQETSFDVVLRFNPHAAADARQYDFHPSQDITEEADGSVIVSFHAGGALEMVWHLFTWGDSVEIVTPQHLRDLMAECCELSHPYLEAQQ